MGPLSGFRPGAAAYHQLHRCRFDISSSTPSSRSIPPGGGSNGERRAADKREFIAACEDFADGHLLRAFSLVGTRGDADLMLLSQAQNLERIHEFHVVLAQSGLMKWCDDPVLVPGDDQAVGVLGGVAPRGPPRARQVPVRLPVRQDARLVRAAGRRALADHAGAHPARAASTRRSTSTRATRSGSTTRSSWSRSRPTTRPTSSTSCSACGRPSRARTRCATRRRSRASRARSSGRSGRSTAPR